MIHVRLCKQSPKKRKVSSLSFSGLGLIVSLSPFPTPSTSHPHFCLTVIGSILPISWANLPLLVSFIELHGHIPYDSKSGEIINITDVGMKKGKQP